MTLVHPILLTLLVALLAACAAEAPSAPDASRDAAPVAPDAAPVAPDAAPVAPDAAPVGPMDAPSWCPTPGAVCGGGCVDPTRDPMHCGGCGNTCGAGLTCAAGVCSVPRPDVPTPDAATDRAEGFDADAATDRAEGFDAAPICEGSTPGNCCGVRCPATGVNASASTCVAGRCGFVCNVGFADCNGRPDDGCEVDLPRSFANCGTCGNVCPSGPDGSGAVCRTGRCALQCPLRSGDCNNDPADGCETNIDTNARACGACGNVCTGRDVCSEGRCASSCSPGYINCGGACTNASFDRGNCGGCGRVCAPGQLCCGFVCINSDLENCGGCGRVCAPGQVCDMLRCR